MSVNVIKRQTITIELNLNGSARFTYALQCVAQGNFPWLQGYIVTSTPTKPYNISWKEDYITNVATMPLPGGQGFQIVAYFKPNVITPISPNFQVTVSFDLENVWNPATLRFYKRFYFDCPSDIYFVLPEGYELNWANVPPIETRTDESGKKQMLKWSIATPATYEFDFTIRQKMPPPPPPPPPPKES